MTDTRCKFSDLPADQCACEYCHPSPGSKPARVIQTSEARFNTGCSGCDEPIRVGDPIALTYDGWVCADCGGIR